MTIVRSSAAAAAVAGGGDGRDPGSSRAPVVSVCVRIDAARVPHHDLFSPPGTTITTAAAAEIVVARFTRPTGKHGRGTHSGVLSGDDCGSVRYHFFFSQRLNAMPSRIKRSRCA